MCVQREREEERKKETERAPGWGGRDCLFLGKKDLVKSTEELDTE